jgi:hypothetical protein
MKWYGMTSKQDLKFEASIKIFFFWFKRIPESGPEQRESDMTVLCLLIIIILICYIIIKLLNIHKLDFGLLKFETAFSIFTIVIT